MKTRTRPGGRRTQRELLLPPSVRVAIVRHARAERPLECCGLLVGRGTAIVAAVPSRNLAESPVRYRLDDKLHIDVRRVTRAMRPELEVLGVYHSHPSGLATPSPTDIAEAAYPDWVYLIVGFAHRRTTISAYRIRRGRASRIPLRRSTSPLPR